MLSVEGFAKINLTLEVLGRRADGYHEVSMVMQSLALSDTLSLEAADEISLEMECEVGGALEADATNLAWRAAELIAERYHTGGAKMHLKKRIPIAAGLAGGSADAAAALIGMAELYHLALTPAELSRLGAELGSDIPFAIMGGTMLATGRGEVLRRLADLPALCVVLAKPPVAISTAWAYGEIDAHPPHGAAGPEAMEQALRAGDPARIAALLKNDLERVTIEKVGIIRYYKERMRAAGALAAMMSGSGPTVFALAETPAAAERIASALADEDAEVIITTTRTARYL